DLGADPLVGAGVDVVGGGVEAGQPSGDVAGPQPFRRAGQVGEGDEAAVALPPGLPLLDAERLPDVLAVVHDRVGAEVAQVGGQFLGGAGRRDRGAAAGAALVEQEHPVGAEQVAPV